MVVAELQVVVTTHHALARDVLQKKEHQCSKTTLTQLFNMGGIENLFIKTCGSIKDSLKDCILEKSLLKWACSMIGVL